MVDDETGLYCIQAELNEAHGAARDTLERRLAEVEAAERAARKEHLLELESRDAEHQAALRAKEEERLETAQVRRTITRAVDQSAPSILQP